MIIDRARKRRPRYSKASSDIALTSESRCVTAPVRQEQQGEEDEEREEDHRKSSSSTSQSPMGSMLLAPITPAPASVPSASSESSVVQVND